MNGIKSDFEYAGQYALWLEGIRVEVKAARTSQPYQKAWSHGV